MKFKKYLPIGLIVVLATAIATLFWITLFSRFGSDLRHFYPPFWSYQAILNGNMEALIENIGNISLFIPVGIIAAVYFCVGFKRSLLIGFILSLLIECCQWYFWLGSFEIDDLIHNTIGAGIGAVLIKETGFGVFLHQQIHNRKNNFRILGCLSILLLCLPLSHQGLNYIEMKRLAALSNREDGSENLLILSSDPVYFGQTDINVTYKSDGSILIDGVSSSRAWIQISKVTLPAGVYVLEGLSGVEKKTVGLELAIFDYDEGIYVMVGHEVGVKDRLIFELQQSSKIEVLISLYPGWEGSLSARPVIYREE